MSTVQTKETVIALLGQPNSGKSTLFNGLTGLRQHVGNWPGKTVEQKEGYFTRGGVKYTVADLPGTYSLSANSDEEIITRDYIAGGKADVVVTDGFTGNILLKGLEGTAKFLLKELKGVFLSSTRGKLAVGMVKGDLEQMKKLLDPSEVGGTPFLGISKPVIKAHGGSDARAITNAVLRAAEYAQSGFIADIAANIDHMRVQGEV